MINLTLLEPESKVIDIGAGMCELPIRLIEKYSVSATVIDFMKVLLMKVRNVLVKEYLWKTLISSMITPNQ
ncbi:hypothetical protein [Oceanobacillus massiliensis]|uniref:hypothetical protein n=1 Tax=Oceanobacillus massiliensis TaxID=1465765 RepID=UPI0030173EDC